MTKHVKKVKKNDFASRKEASFFIILYFPSVSLDTSQSI